MLRDAGLNFCGAQRIADELSLKLGSLVSPRTVSKYLKAGKPRGNSGQRWSIFVRNHAQSVVACDFFVSITATFRIMYVFVAMEVGSRPHGGLNINYFIRSDSTHLFGLPA